jgi:hypothetical protein
MYGGGAAMRRAAIVLAALALPFALATVVVPASASPGYGTMNCVPRKPQNIWPGDGHFWTCVAGDANQDYRQVFSAASGLPDKVPGTLAELRVDLLFFYDRQQANHLLVSQFGFRDAYTTETAHCGNTYAISGAPIVSVVYYMCNMKDHDLAVNPNLRETTLHEMGHAFDLALNRQKGLRLSSAPPSRSAAFKAEVRADLDHLDQTWKADPPAQRNAYVCSLTETAAPSELEQALGASKGPVCEETTKNGVRIVAAYAGLEPSVILKKKMPYFLFPPAEMQYGDAWAQDFAVFAGDDSTSANFLPFASQIFSNPAVAMGCVTNIIGTFIRTAAPPPQEPSQYPSGCPVEPVAKFWES